MRIPILQKLLAKLLADDLPALMVLPNQIRIDIPPSVTTVAEAAVGRDAIMQAVASAVLQADTLEASLASALPLGPQGAAGGISLPDSFVGELSVILREGRNLPVWGTSLQSNPWCRIVLDEQAVTSKRNKETSTKSDHRNPVWNQEFQFLVQDPATAHLQFYVKDSHLTGRTEVGHARLPLIQLPVGFSPLFPSLNLCDTSDN
jgi:Ca2+-dependent lipid-binding protein